MLVPRKKKEPVDYGFTEITYEYVEEKTFKDIDATKLYNLIRQHEETRKWRRKYKEKGQIDLEQAIARAEKKLALDNRNKNN